MPPYIPQADRAHARTQPHNGGELCYAISMLCKEYIEYRGQSYANYGDVRHALASAWDQAFAPRLRDYELAKIFENGDL